MSRHKNKFIILILSSILFTAFYAFLIGGITIKVVERNHARNMIEAIKEDNIEELTRLAKKKINKDAKPNFFVVDRPNSQSLIVACANHNFEAIKILIENGANPNVVGINGTTPIIKAACGNCEEYYEIIYYLIEHGADISQTDYYGNSALPFIILNDASEKN